MKAMKILLGIFLMLVLAQVAFAAGTKLLITDIDVKVDDKSSKNLDDGDKIRRDAVPESEVEFKITVENNFTSAEDLDIEDIQVTVTIEGIDDDEDLDEDAKEFDLKSGKDKTVTVNFNLPLEVDEGTYDVVIEVEGDDENGTTHTTTATLDLEVNKENHEVRFLRKSLSPSELSCQRSTQLAIGVVNTGSNDEDDTILEITNAELEINFRETFDLVEDPFDSDSKFTKVYTIRLPDEQSAGIYPILAQVTYDDGSEIESTTLDLIVTDCERSVKEVVKEVVEEEPEVVVVTPPQPTVPTTPAVTVTQPTATVSEDASLLSSGGFVAALIVGEVLVVIIAIVLIVTLMRRRP